MSNQAVGIQNLWGLVMSGGFSMYPLVLCSLAVWGVIFERLWSFRRLGNQLRSFHLEAMNALLRNDFEALRRLCHTYSTLPTARLVAVALERLSSKDVRLKGKWLEAVDRSRQLINQELRSNLWILGTIGSSAPFIGLFGTVVGILRSFQEMARTGSGGFAIVAAGISESLVATAAGIVVAVVGVMAFNAFQTRWSNLVLTIRVNTEELTEVLSSVLAEESLVGSVSTKGPGSGV
ncbi:MAG: MotA/TolQ/ExbB proton channel family protein [Bdellovibrionia bacterium]